MPAELKAKISIFVKAQLPAVYKEDEIMFQKFVEAY